MDFITEIIGRSEATLSLKHLIRSVAGSDATVLVIGESGTGKELVARALHTESPRAHKNFVPVNCGAIPRELIESELFGHKKGSFTGAISDRIGRFEQAHGGTLFLDEIGDLALDMQVKLLRAIQERVVDPVGGGKSLPVDVRVVAATHRDLEKEVEAGRFREDLYYRLNVLPVTTPPLRDRRDDLPLLIEHFAREHATRGFAPIRFAESLMSVLADYHWPGNIRELSNLVARFSALYGGHPGRSAPICYYEIPVTMLPKGLRGLTPDRTESDHQAQEAAPVVQWGANGASEVKGANGAHWTNGTGSANGSHHANGWQAEPSDAEDEAEYEPNPIEALIAFTQESSVFVPDGVPLKKKLSDFERGLIERALDHAEGNVSKTARLLNVQRTTLIEKINKYELKARADS